MSAHTFDEFVVQRRKNLARIARHTFGEYEFSDVAGEAYLMAADIGQRRGRAIDWSCRADQEQVLAYLYQKLVRYQERTVRFAIRLDKSDDDESSDFVHPLVRTLASDGGRDPLAIVLERENHRPSRAELRYCLATAYIRLLQHFDNRMVSVANHLLISLAHAYRCHQKAKIFASNQAPMPGKTMTKSFLPGPWRTFRLRRTPRQLTFEFGEQLSLLECGSECRGS
jgi:hypothetical protein